MWLTRLSLRNPILILMISLGLVVLGATSLEQMPVDLFPNFSLPVLIVGTIYEGASPEDVEKTVTYQIEKAVTSVSNVDHVQSVSREGLSIVQVWLRWGANIEAATVEVMQHIQQIANVLPAGIQQPFVVKFDVSNLPVCDVTVSGPGFDERALYDLAYNTIEPQLEQLPGVATVTVNGGKIRQITIGVDRDKMEAAAVSILDVVNAIGNSTLIQPSGWIDIGERQYNIFSNSQFQVVPRIGDVVVAARAGVPVRVRDVATVEDSSEEQTNVVRVNGQHAVYLAVNKQPGANTVQVVDAVRRRMKSLVGVPPGLKLNLTFDQSSYIRESVSNLEHEALQGGVLAFFVILVFLQDLAGTVIVSVAIPLSIVATFLLLYLSGQSVNVFTLGGLALGVGRMVDDAIVELENISRHFAAQGVSRESLLEAAAEVRMPVLASTITTVIVFLPIVFITGVTQLLFIPMALAITYALSASYFVSTTVTPLLCLRQVRPALEKSGDRERLAGRLRRLGRELVSGLDERYARALSAALGRPKLTMFTVVAVFVLSLALLPYLGTEFFPATDESQFEVTVRAPVGSSIEYTKGLVARIEGLIASKLGPGTIRMMLSNVGLLTTAGKVNAEAAVYSSNTGPHAAFVDVDLIAPDRRAKSTAEIVSLLRPELASAFPEAKIYVAPSGIIENVLNFGAAAPIDVEVLGYDLETARRLGQQVAEAMKGVRGLGDVRLAREPDAPKLRVDIDRVKASLVGVNERDAANAVLYSLNGNTLNPPVFTDPVTGNEYNIVVQLQPKDRASIADLGNIFLLNTGLQPSLSASGLAASLNLITSGVPGAGGAGGLLPGGGLQAPPPPVAPTGGLPGATAQTKPNQVVLLRNVASIVPSAGPLEISRKYLQRVIDINATPVGRDLGSIAADLRQRIAAIAMPAGFTVRLGGQIAQQAGAFTSLYFVSALALTLVYMVLASQFRSLLDPLIVMLSVPLGFSGVIWILFVTHTTLSTSSFMGTIMMVGIVVSNAVLLIDYTNVLRRRGLKTTEAVTLAGRTRLRPIVMTSGATLVGMLPMALGLGVGSESNAPLARAVIGGLSVSTLLTLFFVPTVYLFIEGYFPRTFEPEDDSEGGRET